MSDDVNLLPCPFCGSKPLLLGLNAPEFWVSCPKIGCKAGTEAFGGKDKAIAVWNRRVTPSPDSGERMREAAFRTRWYYALNEDAEHWYGAKDTRDEAIEAGRTDHNGDDFYICAGTPMRHQLAPFTDDVDGVISAFQNANEELFGEDGQGDPENDWTDDQCRDLARRLNATFAEWAKDHGHDKAYMLDLSKGETVPALQESAR